MARANKIKCPDCKNGLKDFGNGDVRDCPTCSGSGKIGGWDFIKLGETYQYKEDSFVAMVKIIEDNSTDKYYSYKVRVEKSPIDPLKYWDNGEFEVIHTKDLDGYYSGMSQFYEDEEYSCQYQFIRVGDVYVKTSIKAQRTPGIKGVRLTKLKEAENPKYPNNVEEGTQGEGDFVEEPIVGKRFRVPGFLSTSAVQEILTDDTFRTYNSIYKWEILEPITETTE